MKYNPDSKSINKDYELKILWDKIQQPIYEDSIEALLRRDELYRQLNDNE